MSKKSRNSRRMTRKQKQELGLRREVKEKFVEERTRNVEPIIPKNTFQKNLAHALKTKQVVVVIGSAGVGKSFLTMSHTSDQLFKGEIDKVFLSRPAVGMGNTIGLLKGGMRDKYEPYLMPLVEVQTKK